MSQHDTVVDLPGSMLAEVANRALNLTWYMQRCPRSSMLLLHGQQANRQLVLCKCMVKPFHCVLLRPRAGSDNSNPKPNNNLSAQLYVEGPLQTFTCYPISHPHIHPPTPHPHPPGAPRPPLAQHTPTQQTSSHGMVGVASCSGVARSARASRLPRYPVQCGGLPTWASPIGSRHPVCPSALRG